jgi:hypothetical protein
MDALFLGVSHVIPWSYEANVQQDLAYCINQIKGSNIISKTRLELLNEKTKKTIEFLKKEYHLK